MSKSIAVFNQKGGVGKTTTVVNLAYCLAAMGNKVLMVDIDPQGNTTSGIGIDKSQTEKTIYDVLINGEDPTNAVYETEYENLSILPASWRQRRLSLVSRTDGS